jgi:hypothetical protein
MEDKFIPPSPLTTPVLFLIFNRPDTTQKVFNAIRQAKPKQLFVAADGPRPDKEGEIEKCQKARQIATSVGWDCEVKTLFRDKNLGCKNAVSSAIDWFFENVEEGIILEDDCLPSQSFFWFCQELLKYYRNGVRIMHISGDNFQFGNKIGNASYYFSNFGLIWGWATWKRAWRYYDVEMKTFPQLEDEDQIKNIFFDKKMQSYYMKIFVKVYKGEIDTWDYQWLYSRLINGGISVHPNINLVQNIGFGIDASHTKKCDKKIRNNLTKNIQFPLKHPVFKLYNKIADEYIYKNVIDRKSCLSIIIKILKYILPKKTIKLLKYLRK